MVVAGLVIVAGRVVTLEGVTTVRVTVPLLGLGTWVGLTTLVGASVLEVVTLETEAGLVTPELLVEGVETPELTGCAVISVGFFAPGASVRAPVTIGLVGFVGVDGVIVLLPPLLKELPAPVVPLASLS